MNKKCNICAAYHWFDERVKSESLSSPVFSLCCHHGQVQLDPFPNPPEPLHTLLISQYPYAKQFQKHIQQYNCTLVFTSFMVRDKTDNNRGHGPWVWKSGYTIYYYIGALYPEAVNDPKYAQLYFYDPKDALEHCMGRNEQLR